MKNIMNEAHNKPEEQKLSSKQRFPVYDSDGKEFIAPDTEIEEEEKKRDLLKYGPLHNESIFKQEILNNYKEDNQDKEEMYHPFTDEYDSE